NVVFVDVFFVDPHGVGRNCHMVVEPIEIDGTELTLIAYLVQSYDQRFEKAVVLADEMMKLDVLEIPLTNGSYNGFEQRILTDLWCTTEYERVVDFVTRVLHAVCKPCNDSVGIIGIKCVPVLNPPHCLRGVAEFDLWRRTIEVERGGAQFFDVAAIN